LQKILHEWQHPEEREFVFPAILVLMILTMFLGPILRWSIHPEPGDGMTPGFLSQALEASLSLSMALILMCSIWAYSARRGLTHLSLGLFLISIVLILINLFILREHGRAELAYLPLIPLLFIACYALLRYLITASRVSAGTLSGAVLCYLLLPMMFTQIYFLAWLIQPDLFHGLAGIEGMETWTSESGIGAWEYALRTDLVSQFQYFSMTTFTTLGYGDITPRTAISRSLATGEAALGQIYVGIIIAKLVSLYMRHPGNTQNQPD
jgi:Ion channel